MHDAADRHHRVRAIFEEALQRDSAARSGYLDETCGADRDLRSDIVRLLAAHNSAETFLERPAWLPPLPLAAEDDFPGTTRFTVRRRLGAGGMGVVYEVDDTARAEIVALKTLRHFTPADVYRLKGEFRNLADVVHRNLACLYELFADDDRCFFTMELVEGRNFVDDVRSSGDTEGAGARLLSTLRQLVEGVSALHRMGKLHRDIKPSNVLVTQDGRVVILDFGLVTDLAPSTAAHGAVWVAGGTPAYMPPEAGPTITPTRAADWYAVGVTLFEALTGGLPFGGSADDVFRQKRERDAPAPTDAGAHMTPELNSICRGLLHRDPTRRLTGEEVLRQLGPDPAAVHPVEHHPGRDSPFVGRARELTALAEALMTLTQGATAAVCVSGPSGIGKSALLRRFLEQVMAGGDAIVFSGRCYEHESVPYNALDGVVDSLSRYLASLPRPEIEHLLPGDISALSRLFPVLRQVGAVVNAARLDEAWVSDPHLLRQRAFTALRDLLALMAVRQPLVITIDDFHWADADGGALLEELLRPPAPPAILVLVCFRSEEASHPVIQRLLQASRPQQWTTLSLGAMGDDDVQALIGALAPRESITHDRAAWIAREANGSPFLIEQLTLYSSADGGRADEAASFADMLDTRLRGLPEEARPYLETLAICGRPVAPEIVADASHVTGDRRRLEAVLRAARLIRSSGSSERVEPYHDRIRDGLARRISAEDVRRIHGRMALTLVTRQIDDPEALFGHYFGAGEREPAAAYASAAAQKAMTALAFDRAAWFYLQALELTPIAPAPLAWRVGLGEALANAGRPAAAAEVYVEAADGSERSQRVELQRRAAEQFLIGGHIDRGMDVTRDVLQAVGLSLPRTPRAALMSRLWHRARLRWRGLDFRERDAGHVAEEDLLRIDTCWSVTTGLGMVDLVRGAHFSARQLRLALDAGEPYRISRALALEATFVSSLGHAHRGHAAALVERARAIAERIGHPHAIAMASMAASMTALLIGRWQEARIHSEQALAVLRDRCVGATWELNSSHTLFLWPLMYLGELHEVSQHLPPLLAHALNSGNLALAAELRTRMNLVWLAADEPDEGERHVRESLETWSHTGFHRQHYSGMLARAQTALYRGNTEGAWELITSHWRLLRQAQLLRVQLIRIEAWFLRGRTALALAAGEKDNRRHLAIARHDVRRIAAEDVPWSNPLGLLVSAGVAYVEGDSWTAERRLSLAVDGFDRADMALYAAVARRRLAGLQDGAQRHETGRRADDWMHAQHVKNPPSLTRAFASGFPDEG